MEFKDHVIISIKKMMKDEVVSKELFNELSNIDKVFDDLGSIIFLYNERIEKSKSESSSQGIKELICLSKIIKQVKIFNDNFQEIEAITAITLIGEYMEDYCRGNF
ncbi:MAG TPA: hypothetical protein VII94_01300 [Candidatus Saccharimonadales bacterium]